MGPQQHPDPRCSCGNAVWTPDGLVIDQCRDCWEAQEQAEYDDYETEPDMIDEAH